LGRKLFGLSDGSLAVLAIGSLLTLALLSGYRPFVGELKRLNLALLSGPLLLVALAASRASQPKVAAKPKKASSARIVTGIGIILLMVGGCPWSYTPLYVHGVTDSSSDFLATMIFTLIGLPGLVITAIGGVNMRAGRRTASVAQPADE
jgi:hypothetical protein